jgi:hypothetical protein
MGRNKLHGIGVTGNDNGIDALSGGLPAQSAQDIVGLILIDLKEGDFKSPDHLLDTGNLAPQLFRDRGALGFIAIEELMAESWAFLIEGDGEVGGLELIEDLEEHEGKAVDGGDDLAGPGDSERGGLPVTGSAEGMEGAMHDGIAVKEDQKRLFHSLIITEAGGKGENIEGSFKGGEAPLSLPCEVLKFIISHEKGGRPKFLLEDRNFQQGDKKCRNTYPHMMKPYHFLRNLIRAKAC